MGGALPSALLCAALGLLLAYQPWRSLWLGVGLLAAMSALIVAIGAPTPEKSLALWGCWASVIATALAVQLPSRIPVFLVVALAVNAGLWAGAVVALTGQPRDLVIALPWVLLAVPAHWLLRTPARLGVKIVAGWLVAVAILAAAVPLVKTPGYQADHME